MAYSTMMMITLCHDTKMPAKRMTSLLYVVSKA